MNKSFLLYERCVKLHKLGISSSSNFYWFKRDRKMYALKDIFSGVTGFDNLYVPAYTDADLMEELPGKVHIGKGKPMVSTYNLMIYKGSVGERYYGEYKSTAPSKSSLVQVYAATEVDVKHELLIFLKSKNLL